MTSRGLDHDLHLYRRRRIGKLATMIPGLHGEPVVSSDLYLSNNGSWFACSVIKARDCLEFLVSSPIGDCRGRYLWLPPTRPDRVKVLGKALDADLVLDGAWPTRSISLGSTALSLGTSPLNTVRATTDDGVIIAEIPMLPLVRISSCATDESLMLVASAIASGLALWLRHGRYLVGANWPASITRPTVVPRGRRERLINEVVPGTR